jgi:hypothetical protein
MSAMNGLGGQLYARLAQLLAPTDSLGAAPNCLVLLEPAGKTVGAMQDLSSTERSEAVAAFVNVVPVAAPTFLDSGNFYDDTWSFVLEGATPTGPAGDAVAATVSRLISANKFDLEAMTRASLHEPGLTYHPAQTSPADWLTEDGWAHVSFTLDGEEPPPPLPAQVFVPQDLPPLSWTIESQSIALEPSVGRTVTVVRPPVEIVEPPIRVEPPVEVVQPPVDPPVEITKPRVLETLAPFSDDGVIVRNQVLDQGLPEGRELLRMRASALVQDETSLISARALRSNILFPAEGRPRWKDLWAVSRAVDAVSAVEDAAPREGGFHISFDYAVVGIHRPWLRSQICSMRGWTVNGLDTPISNGHAVGNDGLMPLITTRMLVVRNLVVTAAWSDADREKAQSADSISFGPFSIAGSESFDGSELRQPAAQVVAWLAVVVPQCPRSDAEE